MDTDSLSVEEVLFRSQELSNPPYDSILYYDGLEVGLKVLGKIEERSSSSLKLNKHSASCKVECKEHPLLDMDVYVVTPSLIEATDELLCNQNIQTTTRKRYKASTLRDQYLKKLSSKTSEFDNVVRVSGTDLNSKKENIIGEKPEIVVFEYNGNEYIVRPMFYVVYELEVSESIREIVVETNFSSNIPNIEPKLSGKTFTPNGEAAENLHSVPIRDTTRRVSDSSNGNQTYRFIEETREDDEDENISRLQGVLNKINKRFNSNSSKTKERREMRFEMREPTNNKTIAEVFGDQSALNNYELSKAEVKKENGKFRICTTYEGDETETIVWELPLSKFGTIPTYKYEDLNTGSLLHIISQEKTPFVKFSPQTDSTSNSGSDRLLDTSKRWVFEGFE